MALHNQEMSLVLSSDAKPRLKWTPELHQRFIQAVNQLGGGEKATPKSLMRVMGIHGLTLYHLKSHLQYFLLQKYRLGRSQQTQNYNNKQEDNGENQRTNKICDGAGDQINESLQVSHALQMQMEVQRKLQEQIEVQRHLQLRMEAQGKYLQSVLKKAQETLSGYSACSIEVEHTKAKLSQLASMVDSGCTSSSFSVLTESDGCMLKENLLRHNRNSIESSLTSPESKDETQPTANRRKRESASMLEMNEESNQKRSKTTIDEAIQMLQNSDEQVQRLRSIDNCNSQNDYDSGPKGIDLNSNVMQLLGSTFNV
ncbi:hypothetical protein ACS0TY_009995 [Phlomoides rotata]